MFNLNGYWTKQMSNVDLVELHAGEVYQQLKNFIGNQPITAINVLTFCLHGMQLVEKIPKLQGREKKELVVRAMTRLIAEAGAEPILVTLLGDFIDKSVSLEKGQIQIKINPAACCGCW